MQNKINNYIANLINDPNKILSKVATQHQKMQNVLPHVEKETGALLYNLVLGCNAKYILELGTCLGYSSIWLGEALKLTGGKLITIEREEELFWIARENIKEAGLNDIVELVCGDVTEVLPCLQNEYDIVFQDSQKNLYVPLLNECHRLTKKGGLVIADDTLLLFKNKYQTIKNAVDNYNKVVFKDKRFYSTLIPVGDGITMSVKL